MSEHNGAREELRLQRTRSVSEPCAELFFISNSLLSTSAIALRALGFVCGPAFGGLDDLT